MSRALAAALVASAVALAARGDARADGPLYTAPKSPPAATGWIEVHTGLTFADSLTLDQTSALLEGAGAPGMVLGIGAHWRTTRIDLGLMFESTSSFYFKVIEKEFATGGQFRAAANLRWRYIEDAWGALFMRLTPGLMAFRHADPVRQQVAVLDGSQLEDVDQHSVGFSLGFDFGVILYLSDKLAFTVDLDIVSATTTLGTQGGEVDYGLVRGLFTAGIEWRM
ncbi:MAG: hypothetical protein U1F43_07650 [Myxococcota bacterium]